MRNIRIGDVPWAEFSTAVGARRRSQWINRFIRAVNRNPRLWREFAAIADARGEDFGEALEKAITQYRNRDE